MRWELSCDSWRVCEQLLAAVCEQVVLCVCTDGARCVYKLCAVCACTAGVAHFRCSQVWAGGYSSASADLRLAGHAWDACLRLPLLVNYVGHIRIYSYVAPICNSMEHANAQLFNYSSVYIKHNGQFLKIFSMCVHIMLQSGVLFMLFVCYITMY